MMKTARDVRYFLSPPVNPQSPVHRLVTTGSQADLTRFAMSCGARAECVRPVTLAGAQVVDGGYALLTTKQVQWARRAGAVDIGPHPEDANLDQLVIIGQAFRRTG